VNLDTMNASIPSSDQTEIRPLRLDDLPELRLRRHFRFDTEEVASILARNPGASFWSPATDELILVGEWRHRPGLYAIHALSATRNETALIDRARDHAREKGIKALLRVDANELRRPVFYAKHGFRIVDRIATYELDEETAVARRGAGNDALMFVRVLPGDKVGAAKMETLDHLAFPWFWWNEKGEIDVYLELPGVEVWLGMLHGKVVSYIGMTHFGNWGHLDRIATHPSHQRSGIGTASLEMAIDLMRRHGARRIALSTQGENAPAQRMYERRGFVRTPAHDYTVHGIVFDETIMTHPVREREVSPRHRQPMEREQ
jgi:ribosomal protein S18 acetylase RimI-like enzyme